MPYVAFLTDHSLSLVVEFFSFALKDRPFSVESRNRTGKTRRVRNQTGGQNQTGTISKGPIKPVMARPSGMRRGRALWRYNQETVPVRRQRRGRETRAERNRQNQTGTTTPDLCRSGSALQHSKSGASLRGQMRCDSSRKQSGELNEGQLRFQVRIASLRPAVA